MRKVGAFVLVFALGLAGAGAIHAQAEPGDGNEQVPIESDWDIYAPELYSRGDQIFMISLGLSVPTVFIGQDGVIEHNFSPPLGGTGALAYNYFLNSHLSVGGEIGGMFLYTVGGNTVFIIPVGLRLGYQFVFRRFEIPLTLVLGMAPQRYLNLGYLGLFAKGGISLFYRFNPDWSFGVNANWGWYPQWTREPAMDVHGNIADITISARYHF